MQNGSPDENPNIEHSIECRQAANLGINDKHNHLLSEEFWIRIQAKRHKESVFAQNDTVTKTEPLIKS